MEPMTLAELGEPQTIEREAFIVAGLSGEYLQADTGEIPKQWKRLDAILDTLEGAHRATYGVVHRGQPMRYVCGVDTKTLATLPEGWLREQVPGQRYAAFAAAGGIPVIPPMWYGLFKHWVPLHADELSDGPMIEFYPARFGIDHDRFEIWLPLKA